MRALDWERGADGTWRASDGATLFAAVPSGRVLWILYRDGARVAVGSLEAVQRRAAELIETGG